MLSWRRTNKLRDQFGPEDDCALDQSENRLEPHRARDRREELDIRPLPAAACERYDRLWVEIQARFVDDPHAFARLPRHAECAPCPLASAGHMKLSSRP